MIVSAEKDSTCGHQQGPSHGRVESIGCLRYRLSTGDDALIDCHQNTHFIKSCIAVDVITRAEQVESVLETESLERVGTALPC